MRLVGMPVDVEVALLVRVCRPLAALILAGIALAVSSPARADTWIVRTSAPGNFAAGGFLVRDTRGDTLYGAGGLSTAFYAYSPGRDTWIALQNTPAGMSVGGDGVYVPSGDTIYVFRGGTTNHFWGYSISNNAWGSLANAPTNVLNGGALEYPGSGDTIYAFPGNGTGFYGYSISRDTWVARTSAPNAVNGGGALVYPGTGDTMYAFRGDFSTTFWGYSIANDTWAALANAPQNVQGGADFVYPGEGDTIYAFRGDARTDFWGYSISRNDWTVLPAVPAAVNWGGSLAAYGGNIYAARAGGASDFYSYRHNTYAGPVWYVNDATYNASDSFSTAAGSDAGNGSQGAPFLRVDSALAVVSAGETILIDAGTYTPGETLTIPANGIFIIGVDSALTIIDFNNTTAGGARAIYALGRQNLTLRDFTVRRGWIGIWFNNVDNSTIERVRSDSHGQYGIYLQTGSDANTLTLNASLGNANHGIYLWSSSNNTLTSNTSSGNTNHGIVFNSSSNNTLTSNTVDSNSSWGIYLSGTSAADKFSKNVIIGGVANPDSGVFNVATSGFAFDFTRNWWGMTDSAAIRNKIGGTSEAHRDSIIFSPYRLGAVDTAPGADTVAPNAPDTVAASFLSETAARVSWAVVSTSEEAEAAPNLTGYRVYRGLTGDTNLWEYVGQTVAGTQELVDSGLSFSVTYYYRVTAFDNKVPLVNESFYSDSVASVTITIDTSGPNAWYVNDAATAGDMWCSAAGDTANHGLTPAKPKLTIGAVIALLTPGDTVYVDAGTYAESVAIATDSIALIGAGQNATFISSNTAEGIRVSNAVHTRIRDLAVTSAGAVCIFLENAGRGEISECRIHDGAGEGIYLTGASTANRLYNNVIDSSSGYGISVDDNGAKFNIIDSNLVTNGRSYGVRSKADSTTMTNNRIENNDGHGIFLITSETSVISGNRIFNCRSDARGIMITGGQWHHVFNNTIDSSSSSGIYLVPSPFCNHLIDSNLITNGRSYGIFLGDDSNTVTNNRIENNDSHGIYIASSGVTNGACGNTIAGNYVYNNRLGADGIHIDHQSRNNVLRNNFIDSNSRHGITSGGSSRQNLIELNLIRGNGEYGVYLASASAGDTYRKNNILPSAGHPDSAVFSAMSEMVNFERNWLGSTADLARITCGGNVDSIPFRLGMVDTAAGADTVAPKAPDTVATAILTETSARISWAVVTTSEEPEAALELAGYRVYRGLTRDTNQWDLVGQIAVGTHELTDSGLASSATYYYRVTAFDSHVPFLNESFYSDLIAVFQYNRAPVARCTAAKTVAAPGSTITLSAATSSDSDGDILTYRWTIETGTPGLLSDSTAVAPSFTLHATYEGEVVIRVVVTDSGGLADTAFVRFIASFGAPRPVVGLQASATETGVIVLSWTRSPSPDVTQYLVLTDSGIGALPETTLATVVQTETAYSLAISGLTHNREYRYSVIAVDSQGLRSETAHASAIACTAASNVALSALASPSPGTLIPRNTVAVPLTYELGGSAAQLASVASITYQYRTIGTTPWLAMPAATGVTANFNPATVDNATNPLGTYTFFWSTSILDSGAIELRIMVTDAGGDTRVSGSGSVRFVDPAVDSPTVMHGLGADTVSQQVLLSATRAESVTLVHPADTQAVFVGLPAGAFPAATDSAGVYFGMEILSSTPFDTLLSSTQGRVYSALEVKLTSGETALAVGKTATVRLTFRDRNSDGFVDGTQIRWNGVKIFRHSGVAGEAWVELATTAAQDPTATADGWLEAATTRFSIFQLVGVAASANLNNIIVGPNPFRPNDGVAASGRAYDGTAGSGIFFANLPAAVRIEVYTISGVRVFTYQTTNSTGQIQWNVRNEAGRDVASGVYLYLVTDLATNQRATGKVTVIR